MRVDATSWPHDGIEFVGHCPVCGSADANVMFEGLTDRIFYSAAGNWNLQRCEDCGSGYLDPRPTVETIHLAYADYHTHALPTVVPSGELSWLRRLKRRLANGYKNWRFGLDVQPSSKGGILAAFLLPSFRAILDRQYRHLRKDSPRGRLLDVGCGDGSFLENARSMGWSVVGTDLDPKVVENAKRRALDVRLGTTENLDGPFDVITMSHVLEHLHDPARVLLECFQLLAPGGTLWLETPNIDALGLKRFGANWRGLEPPRHLVLFSRASLERVLRNTGFSEIRDLRQGSPITGMYGMSWLLANGKVPNALAKIPLLLRLEMAFARLLEWISKSHREFLAVTARRLD